MVEKIGTLIGAPILWLLFMFLPIGGLYWIWVAIKLGSFAMFVAGILGFSWVLTAPVGVYMMFFGVPHWVFQMFG